MLQFFLLSGFCALSTLAKSIEAPIQSAKLCNGANEVYRELCGCEPSCEYLGKLQKCPKVCRQDCFCAPGYYRDSNDGCVALYGCSISNETENMCRLPVVVGPCFGNIPRFSYNYLKERCEKFYWSGCGGNENHFKTEHECEGICGGVSECPLGIEVHRCSVDPCQPSNCSALLNADCISDRCGGCKAHFYDIFGQEISEKCSVHGICKMMCTSGLVCVPTPDGARCLPDQCANNACAKSETCVPEPCITNPCPQYRCVKKPGRQ